MHSEPEAVRVNARCILVAEDDETNRDMLARYLLKKGYDVVTVKDGLEVLEAFESQRVDLVLLDWMMPELSGIDALRVLRRMTNVPVIMLTSVTGSTDVVSALDCGADDYVTKPYDWNILMARIEARLRRAHESSDTTNKLAERYEFCEKIGEGSFGVVYRARHKELATDVAIKVLRAPQPSTQANADAVDEFRAEGMRACRVQHENAVRVFDFGVLDDGRPFLVMELLRGRSLAAVVREGPMPVRRAAALLSDVCRVLVAAHAERLVHRDIKLSNIFLHASGDREVVKVVDFGIAKILDDGAAATQDGITGSPAYMAPERLRGMPYDGRADVYSVGVCLYELITGVAPFRSPTGDPMSVGLLHLRKNALPPSRLVALPSFVDDVVARLLTKDQSARPTAKEALELLQQLAVR